jgi:hypothetical protein
VSDATGTRLKRAALVCLAIPMLVLAALAIGEVASGTISGLQHVVEILPLAALAWLGWRRPLWGGIALIVLTLILAGIPIVMDRLSSAPPFVTAFLYFILALPLVAGILFVAAARRTHAPLFSEKEAS